nr:hypothetical protein [Amycolatopsis balhimycina]
MDYCRSSKAVSLAITSRRHRVDRVDLSPGLAQAGDQQAARGLDRHRDRISCCVTGVGVHGQQIGEALGGVVDAALGYQGTLGVDQGDFVMGLGQSIPQNPFTLNSSD